MAYILNERECRSLEISSKREWLLTNGIGGYAMGTASGINTRRYHGFLIASTTPPTGRMLLLAAMDSSIQSDGPSYGISSNQYPGKIHPEGFQYLSHFSAGETVEWNYRVGGMELAKELTLAKGENAATLRYRNIGSKPLLLVLRPLVCHRDHHSNFGEHIGYPQKLQFAPDETLIGHNGVSLYLSHPNAQRFPVHGWYYRFEHMREMDRGLDPRDDLFCPCELRYELMPGEEAALTAATRLWAPPAEASEAPPMIDLTSRLRRAAGEFIVSSSSRTTILAGYPWFTDWGRDTMISLPGICLNTDRVKTAREILTDYAAQIFKGLIPNRFVEAGERADYNTVDATLWFANAAYKTLLAEWDQEFAVRMAEVLEDIYEWHVRGTLFGICVDPTDGLLTQGEPGVQLTWMDAKVGDWVVTPRHGKPVEVNGLWINLLRVLEWLSSRQQTRNSPEHYKNAADEASQNFERKFWHEGRGHYLDTVDPVDASLRPNQVIAMALPFTPVHEHHARRALEKVTQELLTPYGLRSLGPSEPGYHGRFKGPIHELDSAYHQGTVWPWLLGSYVTALVRFTGDTERARGILAGMQQLLDDYGLGGIAEVYDGSEPHEPGGCPWQAWSVAEILRAWCEDVEPSGSAAPILPSERS